DAVKAKLLALGEEYKKKFGIKFLISAKDKGPAEILAALKTRLQSTPSQELDAARFALWEIAKKRHGSQNRNELTAEIQKFLKEFEILGCQISITEKNRERTFCFGDRFKDNHAKVTAKTFFELASLSKTLAAAFAIEYFRKKNIPLSTPVNSLFEKTSSKFRLKSEKPEWAAKTTLVHLMNHTACNLHYVNGVPADRAMPKVSEFVSGNKEYGYEPVKVIHEPGTVFQYSGGGFLVLEHLIETLENKSIQNVTHDFFDQLDLNGLTFEQEFIRDVHYAHGFLDDGTVVAGTRKMFPAFAAGAMGTARDMSRFLSHLTKAFHSTEGSGPISHDTAVQMLYGTDLGSVDFMGTRMGLGVFTAEAGSNRLAIHQGANDGFRCIFVHVFDGPDRDSGFTILANGDNRAVDFIARAAQTIFAELKLDGVDLARIKPEFSAANVPQEQLVNLGYKELLFSAFEEDLPEEITDKGPPDPLAKFNLAVGARVLHTTDQRFARGENLVSAFEPKFDPELYGRQGKIMDSWESVRHNRLTRDTLDLELKKATEVHYVSFSTKYHLGNQAPAVILEARENSKSPWREIVGQIAIDGHAALHVVSADRKTKFKELRVSMVPDGGLSRLAIFDESLPSSEKPKFKPASEAKSSAFAEKIPHPKKPLAPKYPVTPERVAENWKSREIGTEINLASAAYGAKIVSASNEHYGPATQIISPYPPLNMFDGFESARSRTPGHSENVVVELARAEKINRIELEFKFFKN
ncbi:MAG: serine hydrolase, partial [Bdellovibrionia bacterium]